VRKDGETIFVHVSVSAVAGADGATQFLAAQVEDVTELRQAKTELHEVQALQRVVIENSGDVLAVLDLDG
jgi:PAS domain-containing protein